MKSKEYYKNLDKKFIKHWSKKRDSRVKYTLLYTSFFALPLSIILGISNFGFKGLISLKFLLLSFLTFIIYGVFVYFIEYQVQEKRFQKKIKENQNID